MMTPLGWGGGVKGREETVGEAEVKGSEDTGGRIDTGRAEMKCENKQQKHSATTNTFEGELV